MRPTPTYRCRRTPAPLDPNADLDRAPWSTASWIFDFRLLGTDDPLPPERFLEACLLWDEEHLYAAYRSAPSLVPVTRAHRDEDLWTECAVELFLAAGAGYYEFEVNPRGALLDLHFPHEDDEDWLACRAWDAAGIRWTARQAESPAGGTPGWQAELALPWAAVPALSRQRGPEGEVLAVQICRSGYRPDGTGELPAWGPAQQRFCERAGMGSVLLARG
ncbi:MAG: carbohydrate-binding family 9-like protein [Candidatus Latescibacterota bacterium]